MKNGMELRELAGEAMRVQREKRDYMADTRRLRLDADEGGGLSLEIEGAGGFGLTDYAHGQMAGRVGIPMAYYRRMAEKAPDLLAENVNRWFRDEPARRMVRTLDGSARAILSDRYRIIDNAEILEAALPTIHRLGADIVSSAITETKLYLKCFFPGMEGEVAKGDIVRGGFVLSNSEIGMGAVTVRPMILRLICTNGATFNEAGSRKMHVGRVNEGSDGEQYYKDDTLLADDRAFLLKLRDTINGIADETQFRALIVKMQGAKQQRIGGDVVAAVETVNKRFGLYQSEGDSVLRHLIDGGDLSRYGVSNAITRASQDVGSYDRASEMERAGGAVIELAPTEWETILKAA